VIICSEYLDFNVKRIFSLLTVFFVHYHTFFSIPFIFLSYSSIEPWILSFAFISSKCQTLFLIPTIIFLGIFILCAYPQLVSFFNLRVCNLALIFITFSVIWTLSTRLLSCYLTLINQLFTYVFKKFEASDLSMFDFFETELWFKVILKGFPWKVDISCGELAEGLTKLFYTDMWILEMWDCDF